MSQEAEKKAPFQADRLIFVIGCPGAGKGTLSPKLAHELGFVHVSVGDELRRYAQTTPSDREVASCIEQYTLVPVDKLAILLKYDIGIWNDLNEFAFIIDGSPRHYDQIETFEMEIGKPEKVIWMDCPRDIAKERVLYRNLVGRDDHKHAFDLRYEQFEKNQAQILEYYESQGKLIRIDTSQDIDTSWSKLQTAVKDLERSRPAGA